MSERQDHTVDRTGWPPGPWDGEPDRIEWRHEGLPCLILRGQFGALCGYVAVPPSHPCHGLGYDEVPAHAHGGLTYSDACAGRICHVPREGEPDDAWWLGFDCAHAGDVVPAFRIFLGDQEYRDVAYVRAEVESLAEQLTAAARSAT